MKSAKALANAVAKTAAKAAAKAAARAAVMMRSLDWRLMFRVFAVAVLSEMGDKTQAVTLLLAGAKPLYVLWVALGSASALITSSLIEMLVGSSVIAKHIRPRTIAFGSAVVFIILGALLVSGLLGQFDLSFEG